MRAAGASVAILVAGCAAAEPPVKTVAEVLKNCDAYLGKPVRVAGFIGICAGYDCHIYRDKPAAEASAAAWRQVIALTQQVSLGGKRDDVGFREAMDRADANLPIGVGFLDEAWEAKAAPLQNSYVVITGTMDKSNCDGRGGTDRSPGIHPTDIRAWTVSEGAPANSH